MSLIKAAALPVIIINERRDKTFKGNAIPVAIGGTAGFAAKEAIEHLPKFDGKNLMSHRYASRMGAVLAALGGTTATYAAIRRHQDTHPDVHVLNSKAK
jgi:hypothetical protein